MIKRLLYLGLLCSFIVGCQSTEPVPVTEAEPVELAAAEVPVETEAVEVVEVVAETAPAEDVITEPPAEIEQPKQQERNTIMILMKTSKGDIKLELDREQAPRTVENFLSYVEEGHYNGTIFHRVINGFMIQGGGFDASMNQKPAPRTVDNEAANGLKNVSGSIAMARTPDPHSASAQFFINVNDNGFLDYPGQDGWGYCVFGKVVDGMDVVDAIKDVPTGSAGFHQDVPKEPVVIESVSVVEE